MDINIIYATKMYHDKPCWVVLYQSQFYNYHLQLYVLQKCMSTLVGLFNAKVSLTIIVSSYICYKNVFSIILNR